MSTTTKAVSLTFSIEFTMDEVPENIAGVEGQLADAISDYLAEMEGDTFDVSVQDFYGRETDVTVERCAAWQVKG